MTSYFVMNRTGEFEPSGMTANQCGREGVGKYFYALKMVFEGACKLNEDDFIIDHQAIDDLVNEIELAGSCEAMQLRIKNALVPFLCKQYGLPMLAYKCTLYAGKKTGPAWMEYVSLRSPEYAPCLALV
jgi:hypothetical protein